MNRKQEVEVKHERVRKLLERTGAEAVLLKSQANFAWFTAGGINTVTIADIEGIASLLITSDRRFAVTNNIEIERIMHEEQLAQLGFEPVQYEWYSGGEQQEITRIVAAERILTDIPGLPYQCDQHQIQQLRYELTEPEVQRYLELGELTSRGIETVLHQTKPGMKESEVVGALLECLWAHRIDTVCVQAAADSRAFLYRHPIPTEKSIDRLLVLNTNARKWGLITTITRMVHFGAPDHKFVNQYEDNVYIESEMIAATRPGTPVKDVFSRACDLYACLGYGEEWRAHHQGGAQGYQNRDFLVTQDSQQTVLRNQCFCWNPSIAGTKSEDAFIATDDGPLMITKAFDFPYSKSTLMGGRWSVPVCWSSDAKNPRQRAVGRTIIDTDQGRCYARTPWQNPFQSPIQTKRR